MWLAEIFNWTELIDYCRNNLFNLNRPPPPKPKSADQIALGRFIRRDDEGAISSSGLHDVLRLLAIAHGAELECDYETRATALEINGDMMNLIAHCIEKRKYLRWD